jgi:hypothetical protein
MYSTVHVFNFSLSMAVVVAALSHNKSAINMNLESILPLQFILPYLTEEFRAPISSF